MALRVISNRRIELTEEEWKYYHRICESYMSGKELFNNLFETDERGTITFLRPPTGQFSMEVIIFLQNIMVHQYLRIMHKEHKDILDEAERKIESLTSKLNELEQKIESPSDPKSKK
ncbi:MAG TPA: hypothetical protein VMW91_00135 [Desulfosporosinus sp.]|nr:hypothetical protein [Desulfosporosinus sp.]